MTKMHSTALRSAVAFAVFALSSGAALATEESLGTVTGTAGAANDFFGSAPVGNIGQTPSEDLKKIQRFQKDATNAETLITKGQFELITPTDSYTQALRNMPNTFVVSSGDSMDGDDIYINGFDKKLINFTLDGIPLNDNDSYTFYSNEFIPSRLISGTRYYPGAESAAIPGLAAFGGSVETYSLQPSPHPFVRPLAGIGSFGKYNAGGLINTGLFLQNIAPTSAWVYFNKNQRDGYFQNNPSVQNQFLFKSVSQIGPGQLTLFFSQNNQRFNYYNGATAAQIAQYGRDYNSNTDQPFLANGKPNAAYTGYNYNQYLNWLSYAKYEAQFSSVKFSNQFYYYYGNGFSAGASTFSQTLLAPNGRIVRAAPPSNGVLQRQNVNQTDRWGNILRMRFPLGPVATELGFWFNHNDTMHDSQYYNGNAYVGSSYLEPVVTDTYEPYVAFSYQPLDRLKFSAGVKYLYATRAFRDDTALAQGKPGQFNATFSSVLPSLGVNYRILDGWHVYANFTQNSNPPGYNQFYTGTYNASLNPQKANTYDIGTIWDTGVWSGALDLFRVDFQNYILSTTVVLPGSAINQTVLANAGTAINQGISWQNNFVINDIFSAYANFGFLDARLKSAGKPFPYAPHHTEAAGLIVRYRGFRGSIGVNQIGNAYYALGGSFLPLGSRFYTDASLRYTFRNAPLGRSLGFKSVSAGLYLNNLFDRSYIQSYTGSSGNPNRKLNLPTNVYASLEATF